MSTDEPISFTAHLDAPDDLGTWQRGLRDTNRRAIQAARRREWLAQRAIEDAERRAWIEAGNETRQPPEYRGQVFEHADRDGVHPTPFPPLRESAGGELSDEFIAFQAHNQTRYETHPHYYCVACKIRYNARDGGMCGPCLGELSTTDKTPIPGMTRSLPASSRGSSRGSSSVSSSVYPT